MTYPTQHNAANKRLLRQTPQAWSAGFAGVLRGMGLCLPQNIVKNPKKTSSIILGLILILGPLWFSGIVEAAAPTIQSTSLAAQSSNTTSITVTKPAGTASGDLLVAILVTDANEALSPPDGTWTAITADITNSHTSRSSISLPGAQMSGPTSACTGVPGTTPPHPSMW